MKVFDHLFDDFFNQIIIDELQNASFNFASDPPPEGKSDSGFIHMSLHDGKVDSFISSKLNVYGEIITKKIFSLMPELNEYYPRPFLLIIIASLVQELIIKTQTQIII